MNILKSFQKEIYSGLEGLLATNNIAMIAAATGSGKTEIMCQYVADHPELRILILAHGQKSLRTNFSDRLAKHKLKAFEMEGSNKQNVTLANKAQVVVALPQNIHRKLDVLKRFDVIVVDESHEFYMSHRNATMYPKVKDWHLGKWILLSASHYRLDVPKVFFSREKALNVGQIADATVKLIEEKDLEIDDKDISADGFLRESVAVPTSVKVIAKVLKEAGRIPAIISKHSAAAAHELARDLKKVYKGSIAVSEHGSDKDSDTLAAFKAGKIDVCIVVYRGNLGFDYPGLCTFIDGSYTTNIPRMEQKLGRVVRICGDKQKKFIKLVPANAWERGILLGTAVLALSKDEIYREWKGDEGKIKLPGKPEELVAHLRNSTQQESFAEGAAGESGEVEGELVGQAAEAANEPVSSPQAFTAKEPKMRTRKTLELSFGNMIGMFKGDSCTLRQAINFAGVGSGRDSGGKKQQILEFARVNGRRPSQVKPEEKKLWQAAASYTSPRNDCYDPEFAARLNELAPSNSDSKKEAILEFIKVNGRRPSQVKPKEKKLNGAMTRYTSPSHGSYDPEFKAAIDELLKK